MKILIFLFCIVLVLNFILDFQKINTVDGQKAFIRVLFDTFLIIAFAIIGKGRF